LRLGRWREDPSEPDHPGSPLLQPAPTSRCLRSTIAVELFHRFEVHRTSPINPPTAPRHPVELASRWAPIAAPTDRSGAAQTITLPLEPPPGISGHRSARADHNARVPRFAMWLAASRLSADSGRRTSGAGHPTEVSAFRSRAWLRSSRRRWRSGRTLRRWKRAPGQIALVQLPTDKPPIEIFAHANATKRSSSRYQTAIARSPNRCR